MNEQKGNNECFTCSCKESCDAVERSSAQPDSPNHWAENPQGSHINGSITCGSAILNTFLREKIIREYLFMAKYNRGDVVLLISGGMLMTVTGVFVDNSNDMKMNLAYEVYRMIFGGPSPAFYACSWFERKANKEKVFPEESLKRVMIDNEGTRPYSPDYHLDN